MKVFSQNLLNAGGNQVISSALSDPITNSFSSSIEHLTSIDNSNTSIKFLASGSAGIFSSEDGKNYSNLLSAPSNMGIYSVLIPAYTNMNYNIGILFYIDVAQRKTKVAGFSKEGVINNAIYLNYAMNPRDCIYHNNKYYMIGEDSYGIAETNNGYIFIGDNVQTWNDPIILPNEYQPKHIVYGNEMFVISDGGSCIYTTDFISFSQPVVLPTTIGGILYDKGYFYILGYDGIYRSKNLYNWSKLYDGNYSSSKASIGIGKLAVLNKTSLGTSALNLITTINYKDFKNITVDDSLSGSYYAIAYGHNMFSIIGGNKAYNMMWGIEE